MKSSLTKTLLIVLSAVLVFNCAARADNETGTLKATLELRLVDGVMVPFQSGFPVPDFEPQDRKKLSLDGEWKKQRVAVDHGFTLTDRAAGGLAAIEQEGGGRHLAAYDDADWEVHELPGVESDMPGDDQSPPEPYHNGVWYRKSISVPADWSGRVNRLVCLGANYVFDLWVNGVWVGVHEGGYTPFALDLSAHLLAGQQNELVIRIDKPLVGDRQDAVPSWIAMDWWSYTGVIQDIYLESLPPVYVVRTNVIPDGYNGRFFVQVVVANSTSQQRTVRVGLEAFEADQASPAYLTDPRPSAVVGPAAELLGDAEKELRIGPRGLRVWRTLLKIPSPNRWTPTEPNLYILKTLLTEDGSPGDFHHTQFGIRSVAKQDGKLLVNGRVSFFPGVARHEEWPDTGRTASFDRIRSDLELLKELHVLFLRTGHYPNHVNTYLLTDRLGFATFAEIPVYWFFGHNWNHQEKRRIHQQMFRELAFANFNRPSVLFWGLSNECVFLFIDQIVYHNRLLADDMRQNFPNGRMITQSPAAGPAWTGMAPSQDPLDVAGWTVYYGVFYGEDIVPETVAFLEEHRELYPDFPVIATEFGSWASSPEQEIEQNRDFVETWSAFAQMGALDQTGQINPEGNLMATSWWCAFDWFTKNGLPDFVAPYLQSMGLVKMDRQTWKTVAHSLAAAYEPYFNFGGLGPVPNDYDDDDDPPSSDDDDADDDDTDGDRDDDDDDDERNCGC